MDGMKYTVFGFDSRLDWRSTEFVDGFPPTKVCSACGVIPSTVALLPCRHVLCRRCYAPSGDQERSHCPLDNDAHEVEDVTWSTTTRQNLLRRKIRCWNSGNGCDVLGAAEEIMDHFEDCRYHTVTCIRCKKSVSYNELALHLETNCGVAEEFSGSRSNGTSDVAFTLIVEKIGHLENKLSSLQTCCDETKQLISGHAQLVQQRAAADMLVAESVQTLDNTLKESVDQSHVVAGRNAQELAAIQNKISTIMSTLSEVVKLANETQASLNTSAAENTKKISVVCRKLQQKLDDFSASSAQHLSHQLDGEERFKLLNEWLQTEVCSKLSVLLNGVKAILHGNLSVSEPFIWAIENWSELKKAAAQRGQAAVLVGEPRYFYGYSILPGVVIKKGDSDERLHLCYHICRGDYDSLLTWPFKKKLHCSVLNANGAEIPEHILVNSTAGKFEEEHVAMPTGERNNPLESRASINVTVIEKGGCVKNDKVFFKFRITSL